MVLPTKIIPKLFIILLNPKKISKQKKIIIFSGKLNKSKGFDIFANTITKILDKYKNWSAIVFGDERRKKLMLNIEGYPLTNG